MATYQVRGPDGKIYELAGPDHASDEDIAKAAEIHLGPIVRKAQNEADMRRMADPVAGNDFLENARIGFGKAFSDVGTGVQQLFGQTTPEEIAEKKRLDTPLMNTGGGQVGNVAGDIAMTAPLGIGAAAVKGLLPRAIAAMAGNAAFEGAKPVYAGDTRTGNAALGGVLGVGGQLVGDAVGRGIEGAVRLSAAGKALPRAVQDAATLGQLADPATTSGRLTRGIEERAQSMPLVGDVISNARKRGVDAWRDDVLSQVAPPGGSVLPTGPGTTMRDRVGDLQGQFADKYSAALRGNQITASQPFEQRVLKTVSSPTAGVTSAQRKEVEDLVMDRYKGMFAGATPGPNGAGLSVTGEQAKEFESFLTAQARQYRLSNTPQSQNIASMYDDIADAWTPAYRSQIPTAQRAPLRSLDAQYAPFKSVEKAATAVGSDAGDFTPAQLVNAIKGRSTQSQFARGSGLLQDAADNGKKVFQGTIPDSGTAGRTATLGALGGLLVDPVTTLSVLGGVGGGLIGGLTTNTGKNLMAGQSATQMLLQQLRANQLARASGLGLAQAVNPD